jgi:transcriptional regulator GlxA family with amidase domain
MRPAAFYRMLRLRYARWLLDNTSHSVTDIALDAGFSDCAHFSRHFKALHGVTPSETRGNKGYQEEPLAPIPPIGDKSHGPQLTGFRVFG